MGKNLNTNEPIMTSEQMEIKSIVECFLIIAGNYDIEKMEGIISEKANIGISRLNEGEWQSTVITITEYFEDCKTRKLQPYYETVSEWKIDINEGQIAFVKADAILHIFGVPATRNQDYFTLIKENAKWKFLNLSFTKSLLHEDKKKFDIEIFAKSYSQAWSGVRPEFVASFFEEEGSLQVNEGDPAKGRNEIADIANGFMTDLPDMIVRFDSLKNSPDGIEFHWTLIATNSGPGGTGNNIEVSGYELWEMGENNLIKKSLGNFPSDEYERQISLNDSNK
ncbi:MAG TPA: nuclear transport factor 2 family protein [Ignavibacteria bacterium]|nr:nuclear transport factor 2 family protein [Ignavibacteria bacterium]